MSLKFSDFFKEWEYGSDQFFFGTMRHEEKSFDLLKHFAVQKEINFDHKNHKIHASDKAFKVLSTKFVLFHDTSVPSSFSEHGVVYIPKTKFEDLLHHHPEDLLNFFLQHAELVTQKSFTDPFRSRFGWTSDEFMDFKKNCYISQDQYNNRFGDNTQTDLSLPTAVPTAEDFWAVVLSPHSQSFLRKAIYHGERNALHPEIFDQILKNTPQYLHPTIFNSLMANRSPHLDHERVWDDVTKYDLANSIGKSGFFDFKIEQFMPNINCFYTSQLHATTKEDEKAFTQAKGQEVLSADDQFKLLKSLFFINTITPSSPPQEQKNFIKWLLMEIDPLSEDYFQGAWFSLSNRKDYFENFLDQNDLQSFSMAEQKILAHFFPHVYLKKNPNFFSTPFDSSTYGQEWLNGEGLRVNLELFDKEVLEQGLRDFILSSPDISFKDLKDHLLPSIPSLKSNYINDLLSDPLMQDRFSVLAKKEKTLEFFFNDIAYRFNAILSPTTQHLNSFSWLFNFIEVERPDYFYSENFKNALKKFDIRKPSGIFKQYLNLIEKREIVNNLGVVTPKATFSKKM